MAHVRGDKSLAPASEMTGQTRGTRRTRQPVGATRPQQHLKKRPICLDG